MTRPATPNDLSLTPKQTAWTIVVCAVVAVGVLGWLGWTKMYENPQRVFWDALANNLATDGVTRHITEAADGQSLNEYVQLELGSSNIARSETTLSQSGSLISTETISTPTTDYTRYTAINSNPKGQNGKPLNVSHVMGVWGKSPAGEATSPLDHLFGQTLLGIVPIANLPQAERQTLLDQMHKVFIADFSSVKHQVIDGQRANLYSVKVEPVAYATLMRLFARYEGLGTLSVLNSANYKSAAAVSAQFAVNPDTHELLRISYPGSNQMEDYSGYGLQPTIKLPTKTIAAATLQQRLEDIQ